MSTLKHMVKNAAGEVLLHTGLWRRHLERMTKRCEAIVLTYHRVIEKWDRILDYSQPGMVVTADTFECQLAFLKMCFDIVPLSFLTNPKPGVRNTKSNRPLCAITFDDGWRDNYEIAFPILDKYNVPATIFLTTDFIGRGRIFWHTELMYFLMHGDASRFGLVEYVFQAYPPAIRRHWRRLVRSGGIPTAYNLDPLVDAVKSTCGEDEIINLVRDVRHALGTSGSLLSQHRFFLDWDQVWEMAGAGIEIGSHGCTHHILTRLRLGEAKEELVRSKAEIEARIGRVVKHFAFPEGAANAQLMALVREVGYRTVSLCRLIPQDGQGPSLIMRRLGMHEGSSQGRDGSFSEADLALWLVRAPGVTRL